MLVTNTTGKAVTYTNHLGVERILNAGQGYGLSSAEAEFVEGLKLAGVKVAKAGPGAPDPADKTAEPVAPDVIKASKAEKAAEAAKAEAEDAEVEERPRGRAKK